MKTIELQHISKQYSEKKLLDEVDLVISTGQKVALVGHNGTGKSTLLKIISGEEPMDSGDIIKPNDYTISYLSQNVAFSSDETVREFVLNGSKKGRILQSYEAITKSLETDPNNSDLVTKFQNAESLIIKYDVWSYEAEMKRLLSNLGVSAEDKKLKDLSGGQQKRVALVRALLNKSDLLLLDEPSNHLDIRAITWLEEYLKAYQGALIMITHDRYFLDQVVQHILLLENGKLTLFNGNYQSYLNQKNDLEEKNALLEHKQKQLFKKEQDWMRQGAKARSTKQQARIERFNTLKDTIDNQPSAKKKLSLDFSSDRLGKKGIVFENFSYNAYGKPIMADLTRSVKKGERIGIIGTNGVGKTSLLTAIFKEKPGITSGETVKMGYYRQHHQDLPEDLSLLDYLKKVGYDKKATTEEINSIPELLERFLFKREMQHTLINRLSGGEQKRLYLISILMLKPNVLLLDEPTNDLDIETLTILETYLREFPGIVFVVSHDRYFLEQVVTDNLVMTSDGAHLFVSNTKDATAMIIADTPEPVDKTTKDNAVEVLDGSSSKSSDSKIQNGSKSVDQNATGTSKRKISYNEKREWETLEARIEAIEAKISTLDEQMIDFQTDFEKQMSLGETRKELSTQLDQLMARWEELAPYFE